MSLGEYTVQTPKFCFCSGVKMKKTNSLAGKILDMFNSMLNDLPSKLE